MKKAVCIHVVLLFSMFALTSCGTLQSMATPIPTNTPDLCAPDALPGEVGVVHKHMREFDDASLIAANTPRDQLTSVISDMQRIRRESEDQAVPPCLATLKQVQLVYMKTVIETLVVFLGGSSQEVWNQGIDLARKQHNQYALEYAKLLGLTVIAPPTVTPGAASTETPQPTKTINYVAVNSGVENVNLFSEPSESSSIVAVLAVGESARALSQNPDGQWLLVEVPGKQGQTAWILASKVSLTPAQ
jgi:hypothetical protein